MMLVEETTVPSEALPWQDFRDHLRLGRGFADDGAQDGLLEAVMRAAIAAVEARTGKALLTRSFRWELTQWRDRYLQALPIGPVSAIVEVKIVDRHGLEAVVSASAYRLVQDPARPAIEGLGALPFVPYGGTAEVRFEAGFGSDWASIPADLRQAVMMLAAHFYDNRGEAGEATMPQAVMALVESHRTIRMGGGLRP